MCTHTIDIFFAKANSVIYENSTQKIFKLITMTVILMEKHLCIVMHHVIDNFYNTHAIIRMMLTMTDEISKLCDVCYIVYSVLLPSNANRVKTKVCNIWWWNERNAQHIKYKKEISQVREIITQCFMPPSNWIYADSVLVYDRISIVEKLFCYWDCPIVIIMICAFNSKLPCHCLDIALRWQMNDALCTSRRLLHRSLHVVQKGTATYRITSKRYMYVVPKNFQCDVPEIRQQKNNTTTIALSYFEIIKRKRFQVTSILSLWTSAASTTTHIIFIIIMCARASVYFIFPFCFLSFIS